MRSCVFICIFNRYILCLCICSKYIHVYIYMYAHVTYVYAYTHIYHMYEADTCLTDVYSAEMYRAQTGIYIYIYICIYQPPV